MRKRMQIDSLNELSEEKRPPEAYVWDSDSTKLDNWLDNLTSKEKGNKEKNQLLSISEIE